MFKVSRKIRIIHLCTDRLSFVRDMGSPKIFITYYTAFLLHYLYKKIFRLARAVKGSLGVGCGCVYYSNGIEASVIITRLVKPSVIKIKLL